jgi:hypothetical protein
MLLGKLDIQIRRLILNPFESISLLLINSTFQDILIANDFLNSTPIAQEIRARVDKLDCARLKSFCTSMKTMIKEYQENRENHWT